MIVAYISFDEVLVTTPEKEDAMVKIWFPEHSDGKAREDYERKVCDDAAEIYLSGIEISDCSPIVRKAK